MRPWRRQYRGICRFLELTNAQLHLCLRENVGFRASLGTRPTSFRTGATIDTPRLDRALRHGGSRAQGTTLERGIWDGGYVALGLD